MKASLRRIRAICIREFSGSAASPAAWVFLVIFLVLSAFCSFILSGVFSSGQADLNGFFTWMPWLFLFIVPALGMPLWADERKSGTFELTLSFPARMWELVLGKYLAGMLLLCIALLLTISTPLTALYLGKPDMGAILCGYLGSILLGSVFLSISCFCSALSRSQTASFLLSLLLSVVLMCIGWTQITDMASNYLPAKVLEVFAFCSILPHFQAFQRGILDSGELIYCLSTTALFLFLAGAVLNFAAAGLGSLFVPGTLSDRFTRRTVGRLVFAVLLAFYGFFCLNYSGTAFKKRWDVTRDHAYSLSPEARALAASLERPAVIRYYVSSGSTRLPPLLRDYAMRVEWLLREFEEASHGKIKLEMLNPEPDSTDEEAAMLEGVQPLPVNTGERVFLGLSVSYADRSIPLPFLSPQQESMLEYEIARAIQNVTRTKQPTLAIMSSLPVFGDLKSKQRKLQQDASGQPKAPELPWYAVNELARDMRLMDLPSDVAEIPEGVDALLVIHPVKFPPRALYAIDQYLMRGGKLAVFLDPRSLYSILKSRKDFSFSEKVESDLEPLISAWGIGYNKNLMAADMTYALRISRPDRNVTNPLAVRVPAEGLSRQVPVTAALNLVSVYFSAVLPVVQEIDGLKVTPLLSTSANSQLVSSLIDRPEAAILNFSPSGTEYPLAVKIEGVFRTAYADGAPDAVSAGKHLDHSVKPSKVYLFGDTDMLFNDACVKVSRDALGQDTLVRVEDNLSLLQNVVEDLCGSDTLGAIRGRIPMARPLTRINAIKARAELRYKDRILRLQRNLNEAQSRVQMMQNFLTASGGKARLTPAQEREVREYSFRVNEFKRSLKALNGQLKRDLDRLDNMVKLFNMILVPLLVTITGLIWSIFRLSKWRHRKS